MVCEKETLDVSLYLFLLFCSFILHLLKRVRARVRSRRGEEKEEEEDDDETSSTFSLRPFHGSKQCLDVSSTNVHLPVDIHLVLDQLDPYAGELTLTLFANNYIVIYIFLFTIPGSSRVEPAEECLMLNGMKFIISIIESYIGDEIFKLIYMRVICTTETT